MAKLITKEMLAQMMSSSNGKITSGLAEQLVGVDYSNSFTPLDAGDLDELDWSDGEMDDYEQKQLNAPPAPAPTPAPSPQPNSGALNQFMDGDESDPFADMSSDDEDWGASLKVPVSNSQSKFPPQDNEDNLDDLDWGDSGDELELKQPDKKQSNGTGTSGWTTVSDIRLPLDDVWESDDLDALKEWLQGLPSNTNAVDDNGLTVLHYACLHDKAEMAREILEGTPSVLIDTQTTQRVILRTDSSWRVPAGSTALHVACQVDAPDCVEVLLEFSANTKLKDSDDNNAAEVAEDNESEECLEFIQSADDTTGGS